MTYVIKYDFSNSIPTHYETVVSLLYFLLIFFLLCKSTQNVLLKTKKYRFTGHGFDPVNLDNSDPSEAPVRLTLTPQEGSSISPGNLLSMLNID